MYTLAGVTRNYRKGHQVVQALRGVDLTIGDGEWLAIQGPTGHGKTTLLQMLGGLDRPSAGVVYLGGQDLAAIRQTRLTNARAGKIGFIPSAGLADPGGQDLAAMRETQLTNLRAAKIGFIFQTFNLIPTLSAQENVETALVPLRVRAAARRKQARQALDSVGLAERARHLPAELSGGQQQRVAIARALVKEPSVLLADEPTGNLDETTRDEIIGLLEQLWRDRGLTLVMVTHDSSVARRAQRTGVMSNGLLTIAPHTAPRPR